MSHVKVRCAHDTTPWFPETDAVFGTSGSEEIVHFLVDVNGALEVLFSADLGLDQMITVDRGGDGCLRETRGHELENGHLFRVCQWAIHEAESWLTCAVAS